LTTGTTTDETRPHTPRLILEIATAAILLIAAFDVYKRTIAALRAAKASKQPTLLHRAVAAPIRTDWARLRRSGHLNQLVLPIGALVIAVLKAAWPLVWIDAVVTLALFYTLLVVAHLEAALATITPMKEPN